MRNLKRIRQQNLQKRKNFLPTLIVTFILWLATLGTISLVDPQTTFAIPLFFILCFFTLWFTGSIILANSRSGLVIASATVFFLLLRYFGIGNIINLFIIAGLAITTEVYLSKQ